MAGDAHYASVSLLLHGDGANGSTTFTDNSPTPKTPTVNGNAQISTAQSVYGGASMYFDGNGDFLSYADNAAFEFGSGDFTIESRVRLTAYATVNGSNYGSAIIAKDNSTARQWQLVIYGTSSSFTSLAFIGFSSNSVGTLVSVAYTFALNTNYAVCVSRSGNLIYIFVDGVLQNTGGTAFSEAIQDAGSATIVGAVNYDATYKYALTGYIDELRITKGVARYTSTYTPAAQAFPNYAGEVAGTITDDNGDPCARTVRLYNRSTGTLVGSTTSDAGTGAYLLAAPTLDEVQRIVLDDSGGTLYNDLIDRVIPA